MKRIALFFALLTVCAGLCFSQQSIFVSFRGNDENDGQSERTPLKTLSKALEAALSSGINRITVIGELNAGTEFITSGEDAEDSVENTAINSAQRAAVFNVPPLPIGSSEIIISGKRGAYPVEMAVLSGAKSSLPVLSVAGDETKIRLEHIEITGGEGEDGAGLIITKGAAVTLGASAVVRANKTGVRLAQGNCIIDSGEVRGNSQSGIVISTGCVLTMRSGMINHNQEGGVIVHSGGRFSMASGTITRNRSVKDGAGVYVYAGGRFDQTAGSIEDNYPFEAADVRREEGSFGNDLTMQLFKPQGTDVPEGLTPQEEGMDFHLPFYISVFGQGGMRDEGKDDTGNEIMENGKNNFSAGIAFQIGFEIGFSKSFAIAVLGEADGGFGSPFMLEGNLLGIAEIYFARKKFALMGGYGMSAGTIRWDEMMSSDTEVDFASGDGIFTSRFYRFGLVFRGMSKFTVYAQHYEKRGNGWNDVNGWDDINSWSVGVQFGKDIFFQGKR